MSMNSFRVKQEKSIISGILIFTYVFWKESVDTGNDIMRWFRSTIEMTEPTLADGVESVVAA